jgi:hypothetical protein
MDRRTAKNTKRARRPAKRGAGTRRPLQIRLGLRGRSLRPRALGDLISIGPAMLRDFEVLGIRNVAQLARENPQRMYARLNRISGQRQDPCVLDVFHAAVAQARNPGLPAEKCQWWYWSRLRKQRGKDSGNDSGRRQNEKNQ